MKGKPQTGNESELLLQPDVTLHVLVHTLVIK